MHTIQPIRVGLLSLFIMIFLVVPLLSTALAKELWVTPADKPAGTDIGNFAVADLDKKRILRKTFQEVTHLGFAWPDDSDVVPDGLINAKLVFIPRKSGTLKFDLTASSSMAGESHNANDMAWRSQTRPTQP